MGNNFVMDGVIRGGSCKKNLYRDKQKAIETVQRSRDRYYNRGSSKNKYVKWTIEEVERIMDDNLTDCELSDLLGRSIRSIQAKRCKVLKGKLL